jgi:hypothetical protein
MDRNFDEMDYAKQFLVNVDILLEKMLREFSYKMNKIKSQTYLPYGPAEDLYSTLQHSL